MSPVARSEIAAPQVEIKEHTPVESAGTSRAGREADPDEQLSVEEQLRHALIEPERFIARRPSLLAGRPTASVRVIASARPLARAPDAADDEVRFQDVPVDEVMQVDFDDLELDATSRTPDRSAEQLAKMTATTLFAGVSREALALLAHAAELVDFPTGEEVVTEGIPADTLFVIVEGEAALSTSSVGGSVKLSEGHVFGEDCLLEGAVRQASVHATERLVTLRIPKEVLGHIVGAHPEVGDVLFELLVKRLVANLVQSSELFAAFDPPTRKDLARLFEVRRAPAGMVVMEEGKRSDGLYIALAGELEVDDMLGARELPLGSTFGQQSLLSHTPAGSTIRVLTESVLLRLPAKQFGSFAAQFPPAIDHLSELATRPLGS